MAWGEGRFAMHVCCKWLVKLFFVELVRCLELRWPRNWHTHTMCPERECEGGEGGKRESMSIEQSSLYYIFKWRRRNGKHRVKKVKGAKRIFISNFKMENVFSFKGEAWARFSISLTSSLSLSLFLFLALSTVIYSVKRAINFEILPFLSVFGAPELPSSISYVWR